MFHMNLELEQKLIQKRREQEEKMFSSNACYSHKSKGRLKNIDEDFRSCFMRDRDKIIHSSSFRRLKDKAQVFLLSSNDMVRTRLTHTLEVSQIARTITDALSLNETLTEAIALGHDLGHTPFGHIGERALKSLCQEWFLDFGKEFDEVSFLDSGKSWTDISLKNFRHNIQSLRVVDLLENKGEGLNLTYEVRDGILHHSKWGGGLLTKDTKYLPITLEGQIVRISDRIAYVNHDLQDALRTKAISPEDIPKEYLEILGHSHSERIGKAVVSVVSHYFKHQTIGMDIKLADTIDALYNFLGERLYQSPKMKEEAKKATFLIKQLAEYYLAHPEIVEEKTQDIAYSSDTHIKQKIVDYIANMTDHYILKEFNQYLVPRNWAGI